MVDFVLVPGGWCGGWVWNQVAPLLAAAGHRVHSLTLTGLGERSHLLAPSVDLETHIADVVNALAWNELGDAVLVGHSYGGMVVTGAADRAAERLRSLVLLDAFLPRDGEALFDIMAADRRAQVLAWAEAKGDGWRLPWIDAPAFAVPDTAGQARLARLVTDHPLATFAQKARLAGRWETVPKLTYVLAAQYDPSPMHGFAARCRADPRWAVQAIDAHHMLPLLRPAAVADVLLQAL